MKIKNRNDYSIIFRGKSNESEAKSNELKSKIVDILSEDLSKKDKERLFKIIERFCDGDEFNGMMVAELLGVSDQVARKLLRKTEKYGIIYGKGTTKDKKYFF